MTTTTAPKKRKLQPRTEPQNEIRYRLQEDRDRFEILSWPKGVPTDGRYVITSPFTFRHGRSEFRSNPYMKFAKVAKGTRCDVIPDEGLSAVQFATVLHCRKTWPMAVGVMLPSGTHEDGHVVKRRFVVALDVVVRRS